jgi:hypothetical protein
MALQEHLTVNGTCAIIRRLLLGPLYPALSATRKREIDTVYTQASFVPPVPIHRHQAVAMPPGR